MKNQIYRIKGGELQEAIERLASKGNIWIASIDGKTVASWEDYAIAVADTMRFPTVCYKSIDAYLDWIRDLDWLKADGYVLVITNSGDFLKNDRRLKITILGAFLTTVLPWWESEVEHCVVEGKVKPFNLVLVD
jgi:hypothetical protein